jgi:hypothetical protein
LGLGKTLDHASNPDHENDSFVGRRKPLNWQ